MNPLSMPLLALILSVPTGVSASDVESDNVVSTLPDSAWADSITALDRNITTLDTNITPLDNQTTEGEETVISLASDVLFEFDKSDIGGTAEAKIGELVADIPEDAALQVHGHTDGLGEAAYNQSLSEDRARTVGDIIAEARPDLDLEVEGFGMDRPVEPNEVAGEDNPEGRALNRRVELRYDE